jgi:hypothetical protein
MIGKTETNLEESFLAMNTELFAVINYYTELNETAGTCCMLAL